MTKTVQCLLLSAFLYCAYGYFSISYHDSADNLANTKLMNFGATFTNTPTADQVADICSRLSGKSPLLWEDKLNLPAAVSISDSTRSTPTILEVKGGVLPETAIPVIDTLSYAQNTHQTPPALSEVLSTLSKHGIEVKSQSMDGSSAEKMKEVSAFLQQHSSAAAKGPVIILHHTLPSDIYNPQQQNKRELSQHHFHNLASKTNVTGSVGNVTMLTEFQISQYQICLWAGVLFVLLVLMAICSMINMEVIPDNILYAKFQSGRTEKRD